MNTYLSSLFATIFTTVGAIALSVASFFGYTQPHTVVVAVAPPVVVVATSSPVITLPMASTTASLPKKATPPIKIPVPPMYTPPIIVASTTPLATSTEAVSTSTLVTTIGTTTLAIQSVPLLFGGTVQAGKSVPVSYLQITNIGTAGAILKGFWIKQNGSAPGESIIGLSTVDDKGGSRGLAGGTEGSILFKNGLAFAPTDAYFAPGQMRLFTIKATMTGVIAPYIGMQLMIDVVSIETTAAVQGQFPIRGTTWTIGE